MLGMDDGLEQRSHLGWFATCLILFLSCMAILAKGKLDFSLKHRLLCR